MKSSQDSHLLIPNILTSRKSIQKFQGGIRLSEELLAELIRLATYAPSTWNLQHWRFMVIQNQDRKKRLFPIVYDQQQIIDCSVAFLVLGDTQAHTKAEKIVNQAFRQGHCTAQMKEEQIKAIQEAYLEAGPEFRKEEAIRNASLAAMQLMLACRDKGLDTSILRFKTEEIRQELNIPSRYIPVMCICVGYAARAPKPSLRLPIEEIMIEETF
ncbi:nitroreductase family protein [Ammoniphilus sp. CFH 90114]|uniref:nitroreductase family protein n=1 Tax=Ammoniphilus sp. CFH 90114 TaxID=2493665 RepID=UPI00100F51AA|nr:nitroreductase family protein [Ammoniphilus sp. CFH 90114]RXT07154.1 nitroreductase family protein [Ammoniphilus sp. CFH 90114]